MVEELEQEYALLKGKVRDLREYLDAGKLRQQLAEIEKKVADPNLWRIRKISTNHARAQAPGARVGH